MKRIPRGQCPRITPLLAGVLLASACIGSDGPDEGSDQDQAFQADAGISVSDAAQAPLDGAPPAPTPDANPQPAPDGGSQPPPDANPMIVLCGEKSRGCGELLR